MKSILASTPSMDWSPGSPMYGPGSVYEGQELAQVKVLSDRRPEGGGIAYLLRFNPPAGRLIKLIAVARSDEHVYLLHGGYCNKAGRQLRFPGDYALNPTGHPHSAFIGSEVITLTICTGEPDEVRTIEVVPSEKDGATGS